MEPQVKIVSTETLSDKTYTLKNITYEYRKEGGEATTQTREIYDRGNGAAILLYHTGKKTVILTRQFRLATFVNANPTGMMIEACAGVLDESDPEQCARRESEEETGYRVGKVQKVFEAYMSPGAVTEILHFFIAPYSDRMKVAEGGGLKEEQENIEVLEVPFEEALEMVKNGAIKDAKTIMLLQYLQLNNIM